MPRLKSKTIIDRANQYLDTDNNREKLGIFLTKFSECEVYTRPYLLDYYEDEEIEENDIKLLRSDIVNAFEIAGIKFDDPKLLTRIFGESDKVGESSYRWLRNKITHELMIRAIHEVCDRNEEIIADMDSFITQVEEQS